MEAPVLQRGDKVHMLVNAMSIGGFHRALDYLKEAYAVLGIDIAVATPTQEWPTSVVAILHREPEVRGADSGNCECGCPRSSCA